MNFLPFYDILEDNISNINLKFDPDNKGRYVVSKPSFRMLLESLTILDDKKIPLLQDIIEFLKTTWLFDLDVELNDKSHSDLNSVKEAIDLLRRKMAFIIELIQSSEEFNAKGVVSVRVPQFESIESLEKFAKDLKKGIEIPINDSKVDSDVKIVSAGSGSVIFYIALGTVTAVKLVAFICKKAFEIRNEKAKSNALVEHSRALKLKNEMIEAIVEANKVHLNQVTESEAREVDAGIFDANDPEKLARLKLGIETVSQLMDKGVQFLPVSADEEIRNSFPALTPTALLNAGTRQIEPEA